MKSLLRFLIIIFLIIFFPIRANSAEILQINSSNTILVGDQNRNLSIKLFCVDTFDNDEKIAVSLLKKEFPKGSKVKIKPIGYEDEFLVARVFNINETKEMLELLISKDLTKETCQD